MGKLESDLANFEKAQAGSAAEEANMIREVNQYFINKAGKDGNLQEVRMACFRSYIDFLESSPVQPLDKMQKHKPLTPEQKLAIVKRQIYLHEIKPNMNKGLADLQNMP